MKPSPDAKENSSRFEKLLVALVENRINFAVGGGLAVIFNGYLIWIFSRAWEVNRLIIFDRDCAMSIAGMRALPTYHPPI